MARYGQFRTRSTRKKAVIAAALAVVMDGDAPDHRGETEHGDKAAVRQHGRRHPTQAAEPAPSVAATGW